MGSHGDNSRRGEGGVMNWRISPSVNIHVSYHAIYIKHTIARTYIKEPMCVIYIYIYIYIHIHIAKEEMCTRELYSCIASMSVYASMHNLLRHVQKLKNNIV